MNAGAGETVEQSQEAFTGHREGVAHAGGPKGIGDVAADRAWAGGDRHREVGWHVRLDVCGGLDRGVGLRLWLRLRRGRRFGFGRGRFDRRFPRGSGFDPDRRIRAEPGQRVWDEETGDAPSHRRRVGQHVGKFCAEHIHLCTHTLLDAVPKRMQALDAPLRRIAGD